MAGPFQNTNQDLREPYHDTARKKVVHCTELKLLLQQVADGNGKLHLQMVIVFGKDEKGRPRPMLMANQDQLRDQLRDLPKWQHDQTVEWLTGQLPVEEKDIPESLHLDMQNLPGAGE